jgi:hypothetical protein
MAREPAASGINILPIEVGNTSRHFPHRPTFDRPAIAQALAEQLPRANSHPRFDTSGAEIVWLSNERRCPGSRAGTG